MRRNVFVLLCALVLFSACREKGEQFEIGGRIASAEGKTLYLEASTLDGMQVVDSARLDADGSFCFHGPRPFNPEFYRLRIEGQIINLSVDSTESIRVEAAWPGMATDYRVEGSPQCAVVRDLSLKQLRLQQALVDLFNNRRLTVGEQQRLANDIQPAMDAQYRRTKVLFRNMDKQQVEQMVLAETEDLEAAKFFPVYEGKA